MQFFVFSRPEIERWNPTSAKHVIISINSTGSELAKVVRNEHTLAVSSFVFADLDQEPGPTYRQVYGEPTLFTREHAKAILRFAQTPGISAIVVHCDAGQSRSAAVAAALSVIYNDGDDRQFWGTDQMYGAKMYSPNRLVYRTILNVWQEQEHGPVG